MAVPHESLQMPGVSPAGNTISIGEPLQSESLPNTCRSSRKGIAVTRDPVSRQRVNAPPRWGVMCSRIWPGLRLCLLLLFLIAPGLCLMRQLP